MWANSFAWPAGFLFHSRRNPPLTPPRHSSSGGWTAAGRWRSPLSYANLCIQQMNLYCLCPASPGNDLVDNGTSFCSCGINYASTATSKTISAQKLKRGGSGWRECYSALGSKCTKQSSMYCRSPFFQWRKMEVISSNRCPSSAPASNKPFSIPTLPSRQTLEAICSWQLPLHYNLSGNYRQQ